MYRALTFFLVAILATVSLAAPLPEHDCEEQKSFKVPVKPRIHGSPVEEMFRSYRKFGWQIISFPDPWAGIFGSPSQSGGSAASSYVPFVSVAPSTPAAAAPTSAVAPAGSSAPSSAAAYSASSASPPSNTEAASSTGSGDDGEVTATPSEGDAEYLSPVTIGGQKLNLDFDTGSSDLWVFNSELPSSESSGHNVFNPSKSSSFSQLQGASFTLQYGDGSSASGIVGFDKVSIGGATVTKQAVELATSVSGSFIQEPGDGLVGLGFSNINQVEPTPQKTFFANVMDSLSQPVFTVDLAKNSGIYEFGTIDKSKYTGDLSYTPIDSSQGYWQFDSPSYAIGGKKSACTTCSPAIADTGTSLLLVDNDIATAYYNQVNGAQLDEQQGGYVYDCSATLPDFSVAVGNGFTGIIKGADMTYQELGSGTCFGGLQSAGESVQGEAPQIQIFGDFFLKNFFVVFDGGNTRLGIANKAASAY